MERPSTAAALPVAAACLLVVAALVAAVTPGTAQTNAGTEVTFDRPVPDSLSFETPSDAGVARVDGESYESVQAAVDAATSGDEVVLSGRFDLDGPVRVETANVTITSAGDERALLWGDGEGRVLVVNATGVTLDRVWVANSGYSADENDAAVWLTGVAHRTRVRDSRVTDATFGIWVDGAREVQLVNNAVVGRESIASRTERGNGIQLWRAENAVVRDNRITDARDGIYYSWASDVVATNNTLWDLRYGVHYMYSDDCRLVNNTAFDNDAGYALMLSKRLAILNNTAVNNHGGSGHGIMVKGIDQTTIRGNHVVGNHQGLFVFNSLDNDVTHNLVAGNDVGVHLAAGSVKERVHHNTFVRNDVAVQASISQQVAWNGSTAGNYWGGTWPADTDDDGVSEVRHRPAGVVQQLTRTTPATRVFAGSPAFDVLRRAESTLPVVETPGVVDHHPLTDPPHDWRRYYARTT
ncbi:nitrous oxide reductase family maturation protein NosD [Haloarculaceae archaeon H-GB2-1]|nr:nitrous oxide reductase family maturation protein NosD [Haloarculaceae archaeon H-GB1-1]MEA5385753.1 nitrous oxide reductase family maturation protein NosD [Haloarculaceae archaeon H-GB11]MEA5407257.1 nitrous oxide reductase family maturation protein NosD [Haloarculaceae archaeon H-GB2-1]